MKVIAKCTNYSGCLVAYRGEKVELADGAPLVCPECGKPLAVVKGGAGAAAMVAAIVVGVLLVAAGAYFVVKSFKGGGDKPSSEVAKADTGDKSTETVPEPEPPPPPVPPTDGPTTSKPATPEPKPTPVENSQPVAPARIDNSPVTKDIKSQVIDRIDFIPDLDKAKKDKLVLSVEKARDMRRIVVVPFGSGQTSLDPSQQAEVQKIVDSAEVMRFRDDLTAVFVVLGFADPKGDDQKNLVISAARGKSVKDFIVRTCGVKNVTHSIGMGSSTLVDENDLEKNRIAEIWAVLP